MATTITTAQARKQYLTIENGYAFLRLPVRRYAIFGDVFRDYSVVVSEKEIATTEGRRGFLRWMGGVKPAVEMKFRIID